MQIASRQLSLRKAPAPDKTIYHHCLRISLRIQLQSISVFFRMNSFIVRTSFFNNNDQRDPGLILCFIFHGVKDFICSRYIGIGIIENVNIFCCIGSIFRRIINRPCPAWKQDAVNILWRLQFRACLDINQIIRQDHLRTLVILEGVYSSTVTGSWTQSPALLTTESIYG